MAQMHGGKVPAHHSPFRHTGMKAKGRVTKVTTTSKATKKKSSNILIRALENTAAVYGLELTNVVRLWSGIQGAPPVVQDDEPADADELREGAGVVGAHPTTEELSKDGVDNKKEQAVEDELRATTSDSHKDLGWMDRGSAPSRGMNETYHGGAKDGFFNGGGGQVPGGLSRRAAGGGDGRGDEDEEMDGGDNPGSEGGGGGGGDKGGAGGGGGQDDDKHAIIQSYDQDGRLFRSYNRYGREIRPPFPADRWTEDQISRPQYQTLRGPQDFQIYQPAESDNLLDGQRQERGSAPSKAPNECYMANAKDGLSGGSARVPKRLSRRAADDEGKEDEKMGGGGGSSSRGAGGGGRGAEDDDKHVPMQSHGQYGRRLYYQLVESDNVLDGQWQEKGSAPSRAPNECYDGGSKDALFKGGGATAPAGLCRRAAGGDGGEEDKMNGSSSGSCSGGGGGGGSGEKDNEEVEPSSFVVTTNERQPSIRLEDCEYPCEWPDCNASIRNFASKSAWRSHMDRHDEESLEGHLEVFHSSARNPPLPRDGYEGTGLGEDWRYKGNAPSRERDERYDGDAKDGLFNGGRGSVPAGLSRKAAGGDGGNEDENTGGSAGESGDGGGGGGGDDEGNDGDDEGNPKEDWTESRSYERRRMANRIAQRTYRKKLKHRLEELERRVGDEDADAPQMHVEGGGQQEIVDEQFIEGFGQQKAHLTSQCFPSQELDAKSKGMTPRRGDRKKYYGGDSKDALFHGGVPNVPSGSIKKAAGGSDGDGDDGKEMGDGDGGGDSGGGDDGENSNEGATSTKTKRQAVVDLQQIQINLALQELSGEIRLREASEANSRSPFYTEESKKLFCERMLTSYAYYEKCNLPQFGNDRLAEIRKFLVSRGLLAEVSPTNTNQARLAEEGVDVAHHGPEEDSLTNCVRKRDWKQKGITPSRGVNECYDGGSKDRLFTGGGARVPKGLSGRAGEDHGDEDGEMGASGNGGGGDDGNGDGGDDEDGHEGTQNSVKPKLNSLQEYQAQLMLLEQQNKKRHNKQRLKQQRKQIESSLQECGCEECAIWEQQLDQYPNLAEIQRWFLGHLGRQGDIITPRNADDYSAVYNTISEWLSKRQLQQRGSAPSRGMNECYNGGAEDGLFAGGGARVPRGLMDKAAGRDEEDDDETMGGSDGRNDGNGDDGSEARGEQEGLPKPHPLQDYQEQMMRLEQLNKRTWLARHGQSYEVEEIPEGDGDYEMEDVWEGEDALTSATAGEAGSLFESQYDLGDELTANPWVD